MTILERILERARGKGDSALYNLHPELENRISILRVSSEDQESGGGFSMTGYYTSNTWVHKAIKVLADNVADLELQVVRGRGNNMEVIKNHEIAIRLENPNPEMDSAKLWQEWVVNMMLAGEIGLEVVRSVSGSKILELWPREAQDFTVRKGEGGRRYRRVAAYKIDDKEGAPYTLPPDQFIHFLFYNPQNPWRGLAPISAVRTGVVIDQLAQAWTRLFFRNQARPDFAIIAPMGMTKTEKEELILELDQKTGGGEGLHRPIVLEEGVTDIKPFSFPPKDIEWIEQRKLSRDEIGAIFGVPDEIMGYGRDTYENFDVADRVLWTLTLVPLVGLRDHTLTRYFRRVKALKPDERIETNLSAVPQLQENKGEKIQQLDTLAGRGYPINLASDWLELGIPHVNGGDQGYLPMSMIAITSTPPGGKMAAGMQQKSLLDYGSPEHKQLWEAKQARLNNPVKALQRIVKREFQRQQNDITRKLRASRTFGRGKFKDDTDRIPPVEELFNTTVEEAAFIAAFEAAVENAVLLVATAELADLGIEMEFELSRPEVKAGIKHVLQTVAQKTNATTWIDLIDLFQAAEAEGEGIPAIQERISAYFVGRKSDWQTERIARTTMNASTNFGSLEAWKQSQVVSSHVWISALTPRTRDWHADAHGQTRLLSEMFEVGGERLAHPGDPNGSAENIINCLCTTFPIVIT